MFILEDGATLRNVIIGPGQTEGLDYYGKLVRSCGNCKDNYGPRNVVTVNVATVNGGVLCGINTNYGDTGTISNACQDSGKKCDLFDNFDYTLKDFDYTLKDFDYTLKDFDYTLKDFDYTLKDFNGLTAFPSCHPAFSNFVKDVQTNEAQEAIDPVAEFAFEDSSKSATNTKSREPVPS
ncbi:putative pectate lyase [Fusarium sp. NRRL 25303]|nr:putative pectate lyase [Fusarium sp. NRRL 25303]